MLWNYNTTLTNMSLSHILTALFCLCLAPITARVCDNELLRCQNGGVCVKNVRCSCPAAYTGLQCEMRRCETELGGCGGADSGHALLTRPSSVMLLLLLLASCWAATL